jgi:hypothetical protein
VNLVVHIPHRGTELESNALSLAQRAPTYTMEWVHGERVGVAMFPSLPNKIDLALQVLGESIRIDGAWASVNSKRMSNLTKLWQRLACYQESLAVHDPGDYCRTKSSLFNSLVGCEAPRCPVPCQFICTPCMGMALVGAMIDPEKRFEVAVALAEIDWCPGLKLPTPSEPSHESPPKDRRVRL